MKKILALLFSLYCFEAWAQGGPSGGGPGPTPPPSPWIQNGSALSYGGCVLVPASVTSGCKGNGTINAVSMWQAGVQVQTSALANGTVWVGSAGGVATSRTPSGDLTISNTGVFTIGANIVTNAKSAQMNAVTIKGNPTNALANASDFTLSGLTALASPSSTLDLLLIYDHTAGTLKSVTPAALVTVSGGITALTGDVTATGPGSVPATLVTAQPGAHTWAAAQTINLNAASAPTAISGTALQVIGADTTVGRVQVNSFGAIAAVSVTRANGTGASPTAVLSGDQIGGFNSYGYRTSGGNGYSGPSSSVQSFATENWTSTANGTKIIIATTPNLSTTLTTALTIDSNQSTTFAVAGGLRSSDSLFSLGYMQTNVAQFPALRLGGTGGSITTYLASSVNGTTTFGSTNGGVDGAIQAGTLSLGGATIGGNSLAASGSISVTDGTVSNTLTTNQIRVAGSGATLFISNGQPGASGTTGYIRFRTGGDVSVWDMSASGHFLAASDNLYDIGASGATRPRNVYVAGLSQIAGSLAVAGCTIGANVLCTTGSVAISSTLTSAAHTITSASASALAVGLAGATNPALQVDASTASSATGLKIKSAAAAGGLALSVITSGSNENLTLDAAGSGTITIAGTSTGAITLTRATTLSAALTYGGVTLANSVTGTGSMALSISPTFTGTLNAAAGAFTSTLTSAAHTVTSASASALAVGLNGATNPALQVDASTATSATGLKIKSAAAAGGLAVSVITSGTNENLTIDAAGSGTVTVSGTSTGAITLTRATTLSAALTYGGVTLSNAVTGTGNMVLSAGATLTGTTTTATLIATTLNGNTFTTGTYTLTGTAGKTLTFNNSITLAGTDATTMTFPSVSATLPRVVASGTLALATSAISSGTCTSAQTASATGTLTTDAFEVTFNADPTAVTGYAPVTTGGLTIWPYPTADTFNAKVCNPTGASITPGAVTLNFRVVR